MSLNSLALLAALADDLEAGRRLAEESLGLRRDLGDRRGIGGSVLSLGRLALGGGDLEQAEHLARESLAIRDGLDDRLGIAACLETLAEVALGRAQPARAARLLGAATTERRAIGSPRPPLEQEGHERLLASLREHLGEPGAERAGKETTPQGAITEELTLAGGRPAATRRPEPERPDRGAQPDVSSARAPGHER